ncbi:MAG: hypothetical protein K2X03_01125 [Bryobacteraceae bacterium]|nr:hypothetical protein [Bryobacteraceae bacterium]
MIALFLLALAQDWSPAVEVIHDETICVKYQARIDGDHLVVRAQLAPSWHTFAMDNKVRATEKLAGKRSLGQDKPTSITVSGSLTPVGAWYQSPVKDFSKPEQNWFSWGFENEAWFATKVAGSPGPLTLVMRGQACSESTCKNIEATLTLPAVKTGAALALPKGLIEVRR